MYEQLSYIFPEIWMIIAICIVLLISVFVKIDSRWPALLAKLSLVVAILALLDRYDQPTQIIFSNLYIVDNLATLLKLSILFIALIAFVYSRNYVVMRHLPEAEYYLLALFSVLGMMILCSADSLLTIYLGIELMSLPVYAMVALQQKDPKSVEASVKYFIMGAIASGLMLYGASFLYGVTGEINLPTMQQALKHVDTATMPLVLFAMMFVLAGILFKLAVVPFHMWAPDVYEGAASSVALFVASAPKIAGVAMMLRLIAGGFLPLLPKLQWILATLAVCSMLFGNLVAISQSNIKRLLGYSAIAHSGYLLLGVLLGTRLGFSASVYYVVVYAFSTVLVFGALILFSNIDRDVTCLEDLKGLSQRSPWFAFMLMLSLFSMAGIPPMGGFFAKLMVLRALILEGWTVLAVLALLCSVVGCFYYLRLIQLMYFDAPADALVPEMSLDSRVIFSLNGCAILLVGILPSYFWLYCRNIL